jgi:hypothetical protein
VQPAPDGGLAQLHVVVLRAREVLEQVAELLGPDHPHVDRQAGVRAPAHGVLAGGARRLDHVELGERGGQRGGVLCGGDHVEVLDAVGHAAGRAGERHLGRTGRAQAVGDLLADPERARQQRPRRGLVGDAGGERGEHLLLELPAEAADVAQPLLLGGLLQRLERVDPQLVEELAGALGPEPGSRVMSTSPGGNFARSFSSAGIVPVSSRATSFSSSVLPIPGSVVTRPSRVSAATPTGASRTALAALR